MNGDKGKEKEKCEEKEPFEEGEKQKGTKIGEKRIKRKNLRNTRGKDKGKGK